MKISLKAARVNANLSQEEAASKIGVSRVTISMWETKKAFPPIKRLKAIAELYGIPFDNIDFCPDD